ncbi:MAG: ABC transporter substrate-binding protein, partial [Algoriphagus sp.]
SYLKDFEAGNPSKMIGFHVLSPLIWGVHIAGKSTVEVIADIQDPTFLISRSGSGSHLMSYVLAEQAGWSASNLEFKIVNNLPGALEAMTAKGPDMFLWEKYTTKPWVDSGQMKRIKEVPSPWPCFAIIASDKALVEFGEVIFLLRDLVYEASKQLQTSPTASTEIAKNYDLKIEDVKEWLGQTSWAVDAKISRNQLVESMKRMKDLGIIKEEILLEKFLTHQQLLIID